MSKVLVTGGCGFIGATLSAMLRKAGHDITILDNLSHGSLDFLDEKNAYAFIEADIRDQRALLEVFPGQDAIIHLAAYGSVVESVETPEENFEINVQGTFNVLNAARKADIGKLIFSSTGGALIGNVTPPVNENSPPRPISPYGASKLACEGYCCAFANAYDMSITALRFANVIGPISWHKKGAVTAFFKALLNDQPLRIFGDGSATRDFLYVDDLCRGILAGLENEHTGFRVYHLASGNEISVSQLADLARRAADKPGHPIVFDHKRRGEVERNFADYALAARELGFQPQVPIEEAIQRTWSWFQKHSESV